MVKGQKAMYWGKEDGIFTMDSYAEGGYLYYRLTDAFRERLRGCYFVIGYECADKFEVAYREAIIQHYREVLDIKGDSWDTDRMASIMCLISNMKENFLTWARPRIEDFSIGAEV